MIYFYRPHADGAPLRIFLNSHYGTMARDLVEEVDVEGLLPDQDWPTGSHLFGALDHIQSGQRAILSSFADGLLSDERNVVLNHPGRFVGRFDLLRQLHEKGINDFNVFRVDEMDAIERWPVFMRIESDHLGPRTPPLHSRDELEDVLIEALLFGVPREDLMVAEICDVSQSGIYRKYGAFRFGNQIVPRHLGFGRSWITKIPKVGEGITYSKEWIEEEQRFLDEFPNRDLLLSIFEMAGIDYGRIDYGYKDGRMQVWEINTNPQPVTKKERELPERLHLTDQAAQSMVQGYRYLSGLGDAGTSHVRIPVEVLAVFSRTQVAGPA